MLKENGGKGKRKVEDNKNDPLHPSHPIYLFNLHTGQGTGFGTRRVFSIIRSRRSLK